MINCAFVHLLPTICQVRYMVVYIGVSDSYNPANENRFCPILQMRKLGLNLLTNLTKITQFMLFLLNIVITFDLVIFFGINFINFSMKRCFLLLCGLWTASQWVECGLVYIRAVAGSSKERRRGMRTRRLILQDSHGAISCRSVVWLPVVPVLYKPSPRPLLGHPCPSRSGLRTMAAPSYSPCPAKFAPDDSF